MRARIHQAFALMPVLLVCVAADDTTELTPQGIPDHQISIQQATATATKLGKANNKGDDGNLGCGRCSFQERLYCESPALFNDHCCCDKLREPLGYAPHECYVPLPPSEPCSPVADNCAEYSRIMNCCCKQILFRQYNSGNVPPWVPYLMSEAIMSWFGYQRPASQQLQNDPLNSEGHNKLVAGAQKQVGAFSWLLVLACCWLVGLVLA